MIPLSRADRDTYTATTSATRRLGLLADEVLVTRLGDQHGQGAVPGVTVDGDQRTLACAVPVLRARECTTSP